MASDFEISIKTRADLKGARELEQSLKQQIALLKKFGKDSSDTEAQLKKVQGAIKGTGIGQSTFSKLGDGLRHIREQGEAAGGAIEGFTKLVTGPVAAGIAVFAAVRTAFRGVVEMVVAYAEAQDSVTRMDAALAQQGKLTEENREKFQALAEELQTLTGIANEQWAEVLARLTQFGANPESIGMDAEAVKNLAGILNGDLQTAALMVGKAIQGNFTAFSRFGISVDENATSVQKLSQLYRELAQRGGGQLEARTKTLSGQFRTFKNALSDFNKELGGLMVAAGLGPKIFEDGAIALDYWGEQLHKTIPAVDGLTNAQQATIDTQEQLEASSRRYEKVLGSMKLQADLFALALGRVRRESEELHRREDEANNAKMGLEMALVNDQEKRGKIDPLSATALRSGIREKYDKLKELSAEKADRAQIQADQDELKVANAEAAAARQNLKRLQAQKKEANEYDKSPAALLDEKIASLEAMPTESGRSAIRKSQLLKEFQDKRAQLPARPNPALIDADLERAKTLDQEKSEAAARLRQTIPSQIASVQAQARTRIQTGQLSQVTSNVEQGGSTEQLTRQALIMNRSNDAAVVALLQLMLKELTVVKKGLNQSQSQFLNSRP